MPLSCRCRIMQSNKGTLSRSASFLFLFCYSYSNCNCKPKSNCKNAYNTWAHIITNNIINTTTTTTYYYAMMNTSTKLRNEICKRSFLVLVICWRCWYRLLICFVVVVGGGVGVSYLIHAE